MPIPPPTVLTWEKSRYRSAPASTYSGATRFGASAVAISTSNTLFDFTSGIRPKINLAHPKTCLCKVEKDGHRFVSMVTSLLTDASRRWQGVR